MDDRVRLASVADEHLAIKMSLRSTHSIRNNDSLHATGTKTNGHYSKSKGKESCLETDSGIHIQLSLSPLTTAGGPHQDTLLPCSAGTSDRSHSDGNEKVVN